MGFGQVISKNFSAGGTMGGDLTLDGDLVVNGDGSGNYDEIVNGNLTVSSTNKLVLRFVCRWRTDASITRRWY